MLIRPFDPWHSPLCTCPPKYSLNPYTGCSHRCTYCYITAYIPRPFQARPKHDAVAQITRELKKIDPSLPVSLANSSDPYPPEEREHELTRHVLEVLRARDQPTLIVTKSDLVARDRDIVSAMRAVVSITITTLDQETARLLEPNAPPPERRIAALRALAEADIPCSVRIDPVIPFVTDHEAERIVAAVAPYCVHITASTLKPRADGWRRFAAAFPSAAERLRPLYFDEKGAAHTRIDNALYLPKPLRSACMARIADACAVHGCTFAACREGLGCSEVCCDGSSYIPKGKQSFLI